MKFSYPSTFVIPCSILRFLCNQKLDSVKICFKALYYAERKASQVIFLLKIVKILLVRDYTIK